jgi:hypothetical protein
MNMRLTSGNVFSVVSTTEGRQNFADCPTQMSLQRRILPVGVAYGVRAVRWTKRKLDRILLTQTNEH